MQILIIEAVLLLFLILVTLAVIFNLDLFACTVLFCAFSFCAVLTYLIFGSPDVAFTEAVIGTMSTVFFAIALKKVDRTCRPERNIRKFKVFTFILLAFMTAAFCFCSKYLPVIGDANAPANAHVSDYYIEHCKHDTGSDNIVSGTLADYRGFDTLFETSVMFVSGLVVTLILIDKKQKKSSKEKVGTNE